MKKKTLFFLIITLFITSFSLEAKEINLKLDSKYLVKKIYSLKISNTESAHIVYAKDKTNSKNYSLIYIFDGINFTYLNKFRLSPKSILRAFKVDETYVFLVPTTTNNQTFIFPLFIDNKTKEVTSSNPFLKSTYSASLITNNILYIVTNTNKKITVKKFADNKFVESSLEAKQFPDYKSFFTNNKYTHVSSDEFAFSGSVSSRKVYAFNDNLVFTYDNIRKGFTSIFTLKEDSTSGGYTISHEKKLLLDRYNSLRSFNSFVMNDQFFQAGIIKNKLLFKSSILGEKNKASNSFEITESFVSKNYVGMDFRKLKRFIRFAKGKKRLSITANKTKDGNPLISIDYVSPDYTYHHNFMWQQQMMWQQQRMIHNNINNNLRKFGPNNTPDEEILFQRYLDEETYIRFLVDKKGKVLNYKRPKLVHKEIDFGTVKERYDNSKKYDKTSSVFVNDTYVVFNYRKISHRIFITSHYL